MGAIAAGRFGDVYVADAGGNRVMWLSREGRLLGEVGGLGVEPGRFRRPSDVGVWGLEVYVADEDNRRVQRFDLGLRFLGSYGAVGGRPEALAISEDGAFLVDGGRMWRIASDGVFPFGQGVLRRPVAVAAEGGRVWVADAGRGEVLAFDRSGGMIGAFGRGKFGEGLSGIGAGKGVCWVADSRLVWAVHYREGVLGSIGEPSQRPVDVAVGGGGRVYVLDAGGKVWVFGSIGAKRR